MPGGIMQLVAYGAEDLYLTCNPDITYFKYVYRRHSNFSMEYIEQEYVVSPSFSNILNTIVQCKIEKIGDLIHDGYIVFKLPALFSKPIDLNIMQQYGTKFAAANLDLLCSVPSSEPINYVDNVGNNLIYSVELSIGGQQIDIQYGKWLTIWNELTLATGKLKSYNKMTNSDISDTQYTNNYSDYSDNSIMIVPPKYIYIPLPFSFCKNPGLAIPLIALQKTDVYINVEFNSLNHIIQIGNPKQSPDFFFDKTENPDFLCSGNKYSQNSIFNTVYREYLSSKNVNQINIFDRYTPYWKSESYILMNFIYLSDDERIKFAENTHEYLITQVQQQFDYGLKSGMNKKDITFTHPVKELVWVLQRPEVADLNDWDNYILIDTNQLQSLEFIKSLNTNLIENIYLKNLLMYFHQQSIVGNMPLLSTKSNSNTNLTSLLSPLFKTTFSSIKDISELNPEIIQCNISKSYIDILEYSDLTFDGISRYSSRDYNFYTNLSPYKYHSNTGLKGTYSYSFGIKPEKDYPSGSCNMSRLNNVKLNVKIVDIKNAGIQKFNIYIYAVNYNVLRIMGGIGSLVFAN